jgi:hypothetical protein
MQADAYAGYVAAGVMWPDAITALQTEKFGRA